MNLPPTAKELRFASFGIACMAVYGLSVGWTVYAAGSLADISCSSRFKWLLCEAGSVLGHMFQPHSPWLGYVLLENLLGVFFLFLAWLTYVRSKA